MSITPAKLHKALTASTAVAVYDTDKKKLILLFKSKQLCAKNCFDQTKQKLSNSVADINNRIRHKTINSNNKLNRNITFRTANDEQKAMLNDSDYIILDETITINQKEFKGSKISEFDKNILIGDYVKIKFGKLSGYVGEVVNITDCRGGLGSIFSSAHYHVETPEGVKTFRGNVLELVS